MVDVLLDVLLHIKDNSWVVAALGVVVAGNNVVLVKDVVNIIVLVVEDVVQLTKSIYFLVIEIRLEMIENEVMDYVVVMFYTW